jgi:hypothetical protein
MPRPPRRVKTKALAGKLNGLKILEPTDMQIILLQQCWPLDIGQRASPKAPGG